MLFQRMEKMMYFDKQADKWDTEKRIQRAEKISEKIKEELHGNILKRGLEFGCGTGLISLNLADIITRIVLLDNSQGMIEILKEKIRSHQIPNTEAVCGELEKIWSRLGVFDVVYSSMVLHHIKDISRTLEYFYKITDKEGTLIIVDLNEVDKMFHQMEPEFDGHHGFNQDVMKEAVTAAGFNNVKTETFYRNQRTIDGQNIDYSLFILSATKKGRSG